jgi:hypothetical protein
MIFVISLLRCLLAASCLRITGYGWLSDVERNQRDLDESFAVHGLVPVPMFLDLPPFDFSTEALL